MSQPEDPERSAESRRPTIGDADPRAVGVDSLPDETRVHTDADETDVAAISGEGPAPVDEQGNPEPPLSRRSDPDDQEASEDD